VGFFDSGVGGLAILMEVAGMLPHHNLLYYADAAHFPYGGRGGEEIIARSLHAAQFLTRHGAGAIVVACNTASTAALPALRQALDQPCVGVVPAVKPAAAASQARRVAVLATEGTLRSDAFRHVVRQFAKDVRVLPLAAPGLADCVERGELTQPGTLQLLERCLAPARGRGIDVLALGCTHYSFLRPAIERAMGPSVTVIDCAPAVARQVAHVVASGNLLPLKDRSCQVRYVTSGDPARLSAILDRLRSAGADLPPGPVACEQDYA
jgi:glutamate racemase